MVKFYIRITFICGFFLGLLFSALVSLIQQNINSKVSCNNSSVYLASRSPPPVDPLYKKWFAKHNLTHTEISIDTLRYGNTSRYRTEAQYLLDNVEVLCIVIVYKYRNFKAANNTWTRRCNRVESIRAAFQETINPFIQRQSQKYSSWFALCDALRGISSVPNWVLVVRDDTFAIVENLRYAVAGFDHRRPYYLGHAMTFWGVTYNSGEAGYALSSGVIRQLKTVFFQSEECLKDVGYRNKEDYYLGKHLLRMNITPTDTRDVRGLSTFHGFNLQKLFFPGSTLMSNYYKMSVYPVQCCSPHSITFKVADCDKMYTIHYLLYTLQLFESGVLGNVPATTIVPEENVWKSFLREHNISSHNITAEKYYKLWEQFYDSSELIPSRRLSES